MLLVQAEVEVAPALRRNRQAVANARKIAQAGAAESKRLCPVRTGALKRSIKVVRTETGWAWGSDLFYAPYVEAYRSFIEAAAVSVAQTVVPTPRRRRR